MKNRVQASEIAARFGCTGDSRSRALLEKPADTEASHHRKFRRGDQIDAGGQFEKEIEWDPRRPPGQGEGHTHTEDGVMSGAKASTDAGGENKPLAGGNGPREVPEVVGMEMDEAVFPE